MTTFEIVDCTPTPRLFFAAILKLKCLPVVRPFTVSVVVGPELIVPE